MHHPSAMGIGDRVADRNEGLEEMAERKTGEIGHVGFAGSIFSARVRGLLRRRVMEMLDRFVE